MNEKNSSDFQFITERIKDKPLDRRKLTERILIGLLSAAAFGGLAALVFVGVVNRLMPEIRTTVVSIAPDEEDAAVSEDEASDREGTAASDAAGISEAAGTDVGEGTKETAGGSEEGSPQPDRMAEALSENAAEPGGPQFITNQIIERVSLTAADYRELFRVLRQSALDMEKSLVTVTVTASGQDWFDNTYTNTNQTSGLIVANNGRELLIVAKKLDMSEEDSLSVTFSDGYTVDAAVKEQDSNTGLGIVGVTMDMIPEETMGVIREARLGTSSVSTLVGQPVMAVGRPFGTAGSQAFGIITSNSREIILTDRNLHVLETDIYGSTAATGVIATYEGEVLGLIAPQSSSRETANLLTAYSISDLKALLEKLSNGIRPARLGLRCADVTEEVSERDGVPSGAYITSIDLDSPAMDAGIQNGDVVTRIGTQDIGSCRDYTEAIMKSQPGDETVVTVKRFGQGAYTEMTFDVEFDTDSE